MVFDRYAPPFWPQAREDLDVITIICANNTYAILQVTWQHNRLIRMYFVAMV